jgi:hypothetical protein
LRGTVAARGVVAAASVALVLASCGLQTFTFIHCRTDADCNVQEGDTCDTDNTERCVCTVQGAPCDDAGPRFDAGPDVAGGDGSDVAVESGIDGATEAGLEADVDADVGADVGPDVQEEVGPDVGPDAGPDVGADVGADVRPDAPVDAGLDVGVDTGACGGQSCSGATPFCNPLNRCVQCLPPDTADVCGTKMNCDPATYTCVAEQ